MSKENELLIDESIEKKEVTTKKASDKVKKEEKQEIKKALPFIFSKKDEKIEISVEGYHSNETGELSFVLLSENDE
jgi:hypothetical protein